LFYSSRVWPLSLLTLRQVAKNLQLNRDYQNDENVWRCNGRKKTENNSENFVLECKNEGLHDSRKKHNLFLKHVKIKKRHEIQQIARVYNYTYFSVFSRNFKSLWYQNNVKMVLKLLLSHFSVSWFILTLFCFELDVKYL